MYTLTFTEIDEDLSLEENFIEALRQERNADSRFFKGIEIYWHLFDILHHYCPDFLQEVKRTYKESPDWWFYNFHKQFRQVDMYDGIGFFDRRISEEDKDKRNDLLFRKHRYVSENKPKRKDFEHLKEWEKAEKDFYKHNEGLNKLKDEIRPLNTRFNSFEMKEPFGGHMDMVMWLTIHNDSHGTLYKFMDEFMAMHFNTIGYEEKRLFPDEEKG